MKSKKALYNITSQAALEFITVICSLILPRFILATFGSEYNGAVASITNFLDYISFLTLGISGSTRVALYKANATGDIYKVSAVLKATEIYMRKVAIVFIGYMFILACIFPYILKVDTWFNIFVLVIIIGFGTFAEYFFGITYKTFLMANQSMYISNIIQIFTKIFNTLICVILILNGQSIQIVKLGSSICFVCSPIVLYSIVQKKYKIQSKVLPDNSALNQRRDVMAHSIANCIHQYTDIFVLTLFTDAKIVSVYSIYNLILNSLRKVQIIFTTGLEGAFGDYWAKGQKKEFENHLDTFEFLIFSFTSVIFSCAGILILPFVKLYTKGVNDTQYILPVFSLISIITYATYCLRTPYLIAVQATGKYKETKNGAFVEAILNLLISLIGVKLFGLIGVMLGTLVANVFRTVQYDIYISKNLLSRKINISIKRGIWLIATVIVIVAVYYIIPQSEILNWIDWIFTAFKCFCISFIVTSISAFIFYKKECYKAIFIIKQMFAKKKGIK